MTYFDRTLQAILNERLSPERQKRTPILMTHVVLGYPTLQESIEIVRVMAESGASLIELQIPFSDPIADGATIMMANQLALAQKVNPKDCLRATATISRKIDVPVLFMSYVNLLFNHKGGVKAFCRNARNAGAQGLIVPDIPPEENQEGYWTLSQAQGLTPIPIISPVSTESRLRKISEVAKSGFVYCISTTGTTGARKGLPPYLDSYLTEARKYFSLPLAVGFGISTPEHVQALGPYAEIAVVGSATIDLIAKTKKQERYRKISKFVERLARGC